MIALVEAVELVMLVIVRVVWHACASLIEGSL